MRVDVVTEQTMIYRAEFELTLHPTNNVATVPSPRQECLVWGGMFHLSRWRVYDVYLDRRQDVAQEMEGK